MMHPNERSVRGPFLLAVLLLLAACGADEPEAGQSGSQTPPPWPASYSESDGGLVDLVTDLLRAASSHETRRLQRMTEALVLPDHVSWFAARFPAGLATDLAAEYGANAAGISSRLADLASSLAAQGRGFAVSVARHERGSLGSASGLQLDAIEVMTRPSPLYSVTCSSSPRDVGFRLWSFVFANGAWRFVGRMALVGG